MPWLILGIAIFVGLVLIVRGLVGLDPRRAAKILLGVIVTALVGITVYMVASRGIGAIIFVLAVLLPMILRWRAAKQFFQNLKGPSPGQATGVETKFLRMNLDHDSGILDGTILEGKFKGKRLSELRESELTELLQECRVNDEQSTQVLEAYLDRVHGGNWRNGDNKESSKPNTPWGEGMTREEAYKILGVSTNASDDEIKRAHHALMKKIHPDQGGSNYLASKLNQAKELLLDR